MKKLSTTEDKNTFANKIMNGVKLSKHENIAKAQVYIFKFAENGAVFDEKTAAKVCGDLVVLSMKEPKLIQANPQSILSSIISAYRLGADLIKPQPDAYVIPYKNNRIGGMDIQFQLDYRFLKNLIYEGGEVLVINTQMVLEEDEFQANWDNNKDELNFKFTPNFSVSRTDDIRKRLKAVFGVAKLKNGEKIKGFLTAEEVEKIAQTSKTRSTGTPWDTWPERMILKTFIKWFCKQLPTGFSKVDEAAKIDSASEGGKLKVDLTTGDLDVDDKFIEPEEEEVKKISADIKNATDGKLLEVENDSNPGSI